MLGGGGGGDGDEWPLLDPSAPGLEAAINVLPASRAGGAGRQA